MNLADARASRARANQERSLEAFLDRKARVDALLARLTAASDDHFGTDPEQVLWAADCALGRVEELLREAADFIGA